MKENNTLVFKKKINSSAAKVYRAFTNATSLREWLCDGATVDAKPGGRIVLWWNDGYLSAGEYLELEPDQHIVFTWHSRSEPEETRVIVNISQNADGISLSLTHSDIGTGEKWANSSQEFQHGWETGLENLKSTLETGKDLRIYSRPMLGILLDEFNADIAASLGVPVTTGIRLSDTLEGMGAKAAGLQSNDVITGMAGKEVKDFNDLRSALEGKQAGDVIEVSFYRGSENKSVMMKLSGRPEPEFSWEPEKLADQLKTQFATNYQLLEDALVGVNETEAAAKPSENEWSVTETLAHLIDSERYNPTWISELIGGYESQTDGYAGNIMAPIKAILHVYPTLPELLSELKRCEAETVAIIRNLPADFVENKSSYRRIAENLVSFPTHIPSHIPQIQAAIAAARQ